MNIFKSISAPVILLVLSFTGCGKMPELDITIPDAMIVVDGWIEEGDQAKVFLTTNSPYFASVDSASLRDLVLSRAKVTLSDGEHSEVLILRKDMRYFPPFYYEGNTIFGKRGKTYKLNADFGRKSVTAVTTIPPEVPIDTTYFVLQEGEDSIGNVVVQFTDPPDEKNFYRIFTRVLGKNQRFVSAFIIAINDQYFNGETFSFSLYRAPESFLSTEESENFSPGDTIVIKLCTMDEHTFDFWSSYQEEVINATNPFASSMMNLESNIEGDGLGVWGGYGVSVDTVFTTK
ncbi:MAG: DUF4249 domain-containing protein [Bacteroidales bacterium]|nr:DUF4249 domain-containing protein [Bacteroidales bacterium]